MPQSLENVVQAALGPDYRPIQYPISEHAKLLASDKANGDNFGRRVALSSDGTTALVGASQKQENGAYYGAAYVFIYTKSGWTQQAILISNHRIAHEDFGSSVALTDDGNIALIGASGSSDGATEANGAAYVFIRSGNIWTQQTKLLASDKRGGEFLGWSVSLSGDGATALVGALRSTDSPTFSNGAAYVFTRTRAAWTQQAKLLADDRAEDDSFGISVSLSNDGNTALIGASTKSESPLIRNGAAYIFNRTGSDWKQQVKLLADFKDFHDFFGASVTLSGDGNTALIGSPGKVLFRGANGIAYVFIRTGNVWTQQTRLAAGDIGIDDYFGSSVSLSGDGTTALIGASNKSDNPTIGNGAVFAFTYTGGNWTQKIKLRASDRGNNDYFGAGVSLSSDGNTALIGASNKSNSPTVNNGAAYVFSNLPPPPTATPTVTYTPTVTNTPTITPVPVEPDSVGVYQYGSWYLRNSNTSGSHDLFAVFGGENSDLPVVGDWNGNGIDELGVYRNNVGQFILSDGNSGILVEHYRVTFGNPGDTPLAGRWTADMTHDGLGVYRNSNGILYQKKELSTGFSDYFAIFGIAGDQGVSGDWNNDGFDSIGIYRSSTGRWFLTNNSTPGGIVFSDIDFAWTIGTSDPVVGDWDGDGDSTIGYRTPTGTFTLHSTSATTGTDNIFIFGSEEGKPVAGKWKTGPKPPPNGFIVNGDGGKSSDDPASSDNAD